MDTSVTTRPHTTPTAVQAGAGEPAARPTRRGRAIAVLRRPGFVLSVLVLALVLGWALAPGLFTAGSPIDGAPTDRLQPPSGQHWFGTDHLGRDLFTRVVHGAGLSLQAASLAVLIGALSGLVIGLVAGFAGGVVDDVAMRMVDVLLAIPGLLLSLAVVTVLGFGTINVAIAVGVASIAGFARVTRSEVLRVRQAVFVEAAVVSGSRWWTVVARHVLPNSCGPVVVLAAIEFGAAVLAVSALSFLGFGAAPPTPEWGSLVAEGRNHLATSWWLTTLPGLVIVGVVLSTNRVARALDREREEGR